MADRALAVAHQDTLDDLTRVATADVVTLWRQIDRPDPAAVTPALLGSVPAVIDTYGDLAATVAADYYDESRAAARVAGTYRASPAALAAEAQVTAMIGWAVTPLWSETPTRSAALERLSAGTDRLIRLPDRTTIAANADRDPAAVGTLRVTRADACAFCLLIATRGDSPALTTESPGRWHDHCRCGEAPSFGDRDDYPAPDELYGEWLEVTAGLGGAEARQAWDRHRRPQANT